MEECVLDFLIRDRPFDFLVRQGMFFFQQLKLDYSLRQSESIYFCNHNKSSTIAIRPLYACLTSVVSSKYISDQHSSIFFFQIK